MRVQIDECLPRRLAAALVGFEAVTVPEAGRAGKSNGRLLDLAETAFDLLVTIDRSLVHQQQLVGRRLALPVIVATSNRYDALAPLVPAVLDALRRIGPGEFVRVGS